MELLRDGWEICGKTRAGARFTFFFCNILRHYGELFRQLTGNYPQAIIPQVHSNKKMELSWQGRFGVATLACVFLGIWLKRSADLLTENAVHVLLMTMAGGFGYRIVGG